MFENESKESVSRPHDGFAHKAKTWDNPLKQSMSAQFVKAIQKKRSLASDMRLMDVGCGTGLVGLSLLEQVAHLYMIDTSPAMLEVLRDKLEAPFCTSEVQQKMKDGQVHIFESALEQLPDLPCLDAIVSLLALHHMDHVPEFFAEAKRRLCNTGFLAVGDLYAEDGSFHGDEQVPHNGFDPQQLEIVLKQCGFSTITYEPLMDIEKNAVRYRLFLLIAVV